MFRDKSYVQDFLPVTYNKGWFIANVGYKKIRTQEIIKKVLTSRVYIGAAPASVMRIGISPDDKRNAVRGTVSHQLAYFYVGGGVLIMW